MAAVAIDRPAAPPRRTVMVQRTALAKGCFDLTMKQRHNTLWHRTPVEAMREILGLLDRRPEEVRPFTTQMGDVALLASVHGKPWPLAFVWDGLDEAEISEALQVLAGEGRR